MSAADVLTFLMPYEPSPFVWLVCGMALGLFLVGLRRLRRRGRGPTAPAVLAFVLGLLLIYVVLQTRYDYYAQHLFSLHRLQHLVLHHVAPFLIAWAAPQAVFAAAVPNSPIRRFAAVPGVGPLYRGIQQPVVAGVLFVVLIWLWLVPRLHLYAMLNLPLYNLMNWGMAVDGLLFWWMMFNMGDPRSAPGAYFGLRLLVLALIMAPQILIGSSIALSRQNLYDVYALCGRVLPIDAMTDQQIGGLLTWIPAAMMSVAGALVLARRWLELPDAVAPDALVPGPRP